MDRNLLDAGNLQSMGVDSLLGGAIKDLRSRLNPWSAIVLVAELEHGAYNEHLCCFIGVIDSLCGSTYRCLSFAWLSLKQ